MGKAGALLCGSVAETKFKEQEQRLEYYKKMYVKTLFTAWRSSTVKEKKIESEFAALRVCVSG